VALKKIKPVKFYFSNHKQLYSAIRNIFGYYPGNIYLYKLAFRHKSMAKQHNGKTISNERLEYLGDAILGAVVADYLFRLFPFHDEGFLTEMRAKIVNRSQLNKLSTKLGLQNLIQSRIDSMSHNKSYKGDAFEAFIGALYLDKGYNFTRRIIINNIITMHFDLDRLQYEEINFKSKLIEWGQQKKHEVSFNVIDEEGLGHRKQYVVEALVDGQYYGKSKDYSIKGAEKILAEKVWKKVEKAFPEEIA
jgi:ribonuclease-3